MLIAGRVVAGLAVGVLLSIVPVYNAELAVPQYRGIIVGLFAVMASFGVLCSNWIGYGCQFASGNAQWRIPLGCQIPTAVILCIGAFILPESPRWCKNSRFLLLDHFYRARLTVRFSTSVIEMDRSREAHAST